MQTGMWGRYHQENPDAFYTNGNGWTIAPDPGTAVQTGTSNTTATTTNADNPPPATGGIAPYYQLMKPPGDETQSFLILRPFVPIKGNNQQMTAFMVAPLSTPPMT